MALFKKKPYDSRVEQTEICLQYDSSVVNYGHSIYKVDHRATARKF